MEEFWEEKIGDEVFKIFVSKYKNKKYDVYKNNSYMLSFGDNRYEQYEDLFGHYKYLDHGDINRLEQFRSRFEKIYKKSDYNNPIWWSWNYLW